MEYIVTSDPKQSRVRRTSTGIASQIAANSSEVLTLRLRSAVMAASFGTSRHCLSRQRSRSVCSEGMRNERCLTEVGDPR